MHIVRSFNVHAPMLQLKRQICHKGLCRCGFVLLLCLILGIFVFPNLKTSNNKEIRTRRSNDKQDDTRKADKPRLGSPPDGIKQQLGSPPDGIKQPLGSPPDGLKQPLGSPPDGIKQPLGSPPYGLKQPLGSPPDGLKQPLGSPPDGVWLAQTIPEFLGKMALFQNIYNFTEQDYQSVIKTIVYAQDEMNAAIKKSAKPYFLHCIGMASCMLDIHAPIDAVVSAFIHSVYVFGREAQKLTNMDDVCLLRKKVIDAVGPGPEYYSWGYTYFPRGSLDERAMKIGREALDKGLFDKTSLGKKLKMFFLSHLCNDLDEQYAYDQWIGPHRYRTASFERDAAYIADKFGYPELAERLTKAYRVTDSLNLNLNAESREGVMQLAKKLQHHERNRRSKNDQNKLLYAPNARKFHGNRDFDGDKFTKDYVIKNFEAHYKTLDELCPDIPPYIQ